ncbi:MAG: hypothetical protein E6R03_17570 [Hyphomicrobiaceae bacterium]|nr:MAG: hypothetical protein E6R03_17570 [Hyphomicrobiaceae bacterium]
MVTLRQSPYSGRRVAYVDAIRLTHTGVIVGQSANGSWQYVRSDSPRADQQAEWHFRISTELAKRLTSPTVQ